MKRGVNYFFMLGCLVALFGCDDATKSASIDTDLSLPGSIIEQNDNRSVVEQRLFEGDANRINQNHNDQPFAISDALVKKYQDKSLVVLDCSEMIIDGASTFVITFSVPLNPQQNFDDLIQLIDNDNKDIEGSWALASNGLELHHRYLSPNRKLTVHVDKALSAINGSQLSNPYQKDITTRDRPPMVGFASNGVLLPSKSMPGLPVMTLNVNDVDVNFFRVQTDKFYDFMQNYGSMKQLSVSDSKEVLAYADLIYSARFHLAPMRNVQENVIIDLSSVSELQQEGAYIAILSQSGSYNYSNPIVVFSISNIGVSVHTYENGLLSVFVHALNDGQALSDIELTALCQSEQCQPVSAKTDKQGYAELKLDQSVKYKLLVASDHQQMSYIYLDRNNIDLSEFNLPATPFYQKQLFTFGPRDLYQRQETVYLNGLLRDADGQGLPDQSIKVELVNPMGQVVKDIIWQSVKNDIGFYQLHYTIPSTAPVGRWAFKFNLGDDIYRYHEFSVEAFLSERMAINLIPASATPILNTEDVSFIVNGRYLNNSSASENDLQGELYLAKQEEVTQLPGFKIGEVTEMGIDRHIGNIEQMLDSLGSAVINVDHQNWRAIKSPIQVILQASLLDSGGRPVTRAAVQSIWPATKLPAIRPLFADSRYYDWSLDRHINRPTVDVGATADFEIAYIDRNGEKLATNSLLARLVRERPDYYWIWSESEGWQALYNRKELVVAEEKVVIAGNGIAKVSFLPQDKGSYRLEVVDQENNIMTSVRFWQGYSWEHNADESGTIRPDQVRLSLDKPAYKTGDIAKVHVEAPVSGSGYISLESNSGTLWMQKIVVPPGGLDVNIPITDWGRHDVYINAMIIRPTTDSSVQTIKRAIGLLYLPIDTSQRQLQLTIEAPTKTQPNNEVPIKVRVNPTQLVPNKTMTVLFSAVDIGALDITNHKTPDPYKALLDRKRYGIDQYDVYDKLIESKGRRVGLGASSDSNIRLNQSRIIDSKQNLTAMNIVSQQLQTITLNEKGEGQFKLTVPDFNGELRLMAQVWDENRFGSAEQVLVVTDPVAVELSTPRFLSGGDNSLMALELNNLTDQEQNIKVSFTTNGYIRLTSDHNQMVRLAPQQQKKLYIPVTADYGFGQGNINISVDNIKLSNKITYPLSRSWTIAVRPSYSASTRTSSLALNNRGKWTFPSASLTDLIDNTVKSELIISNQPSINTAQYIEWLLDYPYGSLEQTISGLYPLLYVSQTEFEQMGINAISDEVNHEKVQAGIARVLSMQRTNGSFGLWSKESQEEYWLTAYTVDFLLQALERGYDVDSSALDKALVRVSQYLSDNSVFYNINSYYDDGINEYMQFTTKAYSALLAVKQNKVTPAIRHELKRLYQQVKSNNNEISLSSLSIMQLAIASKLAGYTKSFNDLLDLAITTERNTQYYWLGDYGSLIRDKAATYALMVNYGIDEHGIDQNLQSSYLLSLSNILNARTYLSTQEQSALFIAGWLSQQQANDSSLMVKVNGQVMGVNGALVHSFDYKRLIKGLTVTNQNNRESIYLHFAVSGYPVRAPTATSEDNTLVISRRYFDLKGNAISIEQLKVGDVAVVLLDVDSGQILTDALVVDLLPAGLVLDNQNLMSNRINLHAIPTFAEMIKNESRSDINYQAYQDDRYIAAINIHNMYSKDRYRTRLMYLVRAATPGTYVVPPPYVESMYHPEWFAVGKTPSSMTITQYSQ